MEVLIKEKGSGVDGRLVQVQWLKIRWQASGSEFRGHAGLGAGIFAPDVQHEYRCDKEQTHHQNWYRTTATREKEEQMELLPNLIAIIKKQ